MPIGAFVLGGPWFELSTRVARYNEGHRVTAGDLVRHPVGAVNLNAWGWLAIIGTITMLAAAMLERYGAAGVWARLRGADERS